MTNSAIYGYKKSPEDKNKWLIDEEAAAVVRRIFKMTIEGKGAYQIARTLTDERVHLRPTAYITLRDGYEILHPDDKYHWHGASIQSILNKPEYMGHVNLVFIKNRHSFLAVKHRQDVIARLFQKLGDYLIRIFIVLDN
jgi:hypothetical protein